MIPVTATVQSWMQRPALRSIVLGIVLAVGAGAALLYGARQPVLTALGRFLLVQEDPRPAQAIVVLSGSIPDRILEAVDLYQAGFAPRIILTQEGPLPGLAALRARGGTLPEQHEENQRVAQQLGVPAAAITLVTTPAWSTLTEAEAVLAYLRAQHITSILLVTSKAHSRRASMTYRGMVDGQIQITVCPSRYDPFAADSWWHRHAYVRRVVIEYGKLLNYLLVDRWRPAAAAPTPPAAAGKERLDARAA
jgi:uncharacterized SAM-binding protein YcdF (DUF218 family)